MHPTYLTRFGTDKCLGTALRTFEGYENRRAWEAILFCYHPAHQVSREAFEIETAFTVFTP